MSSYTQNVVLIAMLAVIALYVVFLVWHLAGRWRKPGRKPVPIAKNRIIVDGSNVMYWGGEPSVLVLARVLGALVQNGLAPIVYFDANVGYKLWNSYASSQKMASRLMLGNAQAIVVAKGVVADEMLLQAAVENGLRVVTNDRFLEWRVQFPSIRKKGFLIKGTWQQGSVILRGL